MAHDLVLKGGSVLTARGIEITDVAVHDGHITKVGENLGESAISVDCTGTWVGPGFVDIHAHLREPGQEWKEDIASGTATAAAGGYTALIAMPNTDPAIDNGHLARYVADQGARSGMAEVVSAGCLTIGRQGEQMAHIDEMWEAGVRMFTDDGDVVQNAAVLRTVMEYVAQLGGVVSEHAMDIGLAKDGHMHEGAVSSRLGLGGIPSEADDIAIARDISLARMTGVRLHIQHLSTAGGVSLVGRAKEEGLNVTAEVTPHHLMFTHEDVRSTDANFKMMPPLRHPRDTQALIGGLKSGIIDAVATDHAPHAATEKDVPFEDALNGVLGLEWAAAATNTVAGLDQASFFDRLSTAPARIAGLATQGRLLAAGGPANIVVFDPAATWVPSATVSKSVNAPYFGKELIGKVRTTVFRGVITYEL